ncbi:MAG: hypothetical protein HYZ42_15800 [Bacteroidetes bacterium]|nr:hypothetical protein [Bacteroidota bacterium]
MEYNLKEIYWRRSDILEDYQKLSNFRCFKEIEAPISDLRRYRNKGYIYNDLEWFDYILKLIQAKFSQFVLNLEKSTSKMLRFLKPIGNNLYFGFEFNQSELKAAIRKADFDFDLPCFNLILVTNTFKKGLSTKKYYYDYHDKILSLGNLSNPFFCSGTPFCSFISIDMFYNKQLKNNNTELNYKIEYVEKSNELFQIVYNETYGENIKKHAYFYFDLLSYSSNNYLEYLEQCITDAAS